MSLKDELAEWKHRALVDQDRLIIALAALDKLQKKTLAAVINVENGVRNGLDATVLDNIIRDALTKIRTTDSQAGSQSEKK